MTSLPWQLWQRKSPWRWNFWTTRCITFLRRIQRLWILKIPWHEIRGSCSVCSIKCKYRDFFCVHSVSEKSPNSFHFHFISKSSDMRYAVHAPSVLSIVNIGTSFVVILFQKNPRAHFIIHHCLPCYKYLMISVKLFQIVVSFLDLVPKSHVPLTIARLRLAIFNGTWDLETTSKTLLKSGLPVWIFLSQISQFLLKKFRFGFYLIFGYFLRKNTENQKWAYAMLVNFEIIHLYVIVPLTVARKGCLKS